VLKNWKDIAIALALAILTWYLLTGREKVEAWVDMSVEMTNAPEGLTIRKGLVSRIEVRVRGPKGLVRSLDRRKWTYSLDVSRLKVGENLVDIDRERIPLSMAYEVVEVKPSRLILTVDRVSKKEVPVIAEWRDGEYHARVTGPQGSGILKSMVLANALAMLPADAGRLEAGSRVRIMLL